MEHADSPSGEAELAILVIGWESVQEHEAVMGTDAFEKAIAPVRKKMLPGLKVLEMRYVKFMGQEGKDWKEENDEDEEEDGKDRKKGTEGDGK